MKRFKSNPTITIGFFFAMTSVTAAVAAVPPTVEVVTRAPETPTSQTTVVDLVFHPGDLPATGIQLDAEVSDGMQLNFAIGLAAKLSSKSLAVAYVGTNRKRVLIFGLNRNVIGDGSVAVGSISLGPGAAPADIKLHLTSIIAVDASAVATPLSPVDFTLAQPPPPGLAVGASPAVAKSQSVVYATMFCTADVNGDGRVDVADLQLIASMASGLPSDRCDLDGDGVVTDNDYKLVLNALAGTPAHNPERKH